MLHLNGVQWVVLVLFSLLWAALGYRLSEHDRKTLGRTPWGLPSALWAFFWFLSLVVGLVLYLIAHLLGVRRARQPSGDPASPSPMGWTQRSTPSVAEQFPAYPQPANVQARPPTTGEPTPGPVTPVTPVPTPAPVPTAPEPAGPLSGAPRGDPRPWPQSPPAWHPDPSGRFHFRWWDGYQWTSQVSTDGHHLVDTNPDQRIGPY